jgi:hypothetical protein
MNQKQEQNSGADAPSKLRWVAPEVETLVAGAAEGSADITSDGPSLPS